MKRFFVLAAFVFLCTYSFAQNVATVNENGDQNSAYVEQQGSNTATITQTGDMNNVNTTYSPSWSVYWDTKGVTQHGAGNTATITQIGQTTAGYSVNVAGIGQLANNNTASITQEQTTANNPWGGIVGFAQQKGGYSNTSDQHQRGFYLRSLVWQDGAGNQADVDQDGNGTTYTFASINQDGNLNYAKQQQTGAAPVGDEAYLIQNGSSNRSYQIQLGSGQNKSTVVQEVGGNEASITQTTSMNPWINPGNTANLNQLSGDNDAIVEQNSVGKGLSFVGTQKGGTGNYLNVSQTDGTTGGSVDIMQDGTGNDIVGLGVNLTASCLLGSSLNVTQSGNSNMLHSFQTNDSNSTVNQLGSNNTAIVNQQ